MPLLDHFHPPLSDEASWDQVHGQWPAMMVLNLNKRLPSIYRAGPHVHLGMAFEIDAAAMENDTQLTVDMNYESGNGTATAVWTAPQPTLAVQLKLQDADEYEIRIFDNRHRRLVSAVEIVSPTNKDRQEHRRAFYE